MGRFWILERRTAAYDAAAMHEACAATFLDVFLIHDTS